MLLTENWKWKHISRSWICGFSKTEYLDPSYPFHFTTGVRAKGVGRSGGGGYSPDWFYQGVYSIWDILNFSAMYLSFADLCRKFQVSLIFFPIFKFCRLSLNDWRVRKARDSVSTNSILLQGFPLFTCHRRC